MKAIPLCLALLGCGASLPREPAILIEAGSECIYAQKAAAYKQCATKNIGDRSSYEACKDKVDADYKKLYDMIDDYRCLLDEEACK